MDTLAIDQPNVTEFTRAVSAMAIMHHSGYCFSNNEVRSSGVDTRTVPFVTPYSELARADKQTSVGASGVRTATLKLRECEVGSTIVD
jgi:hypothetical protein